MLFLVATDPCASTPCLNGGTCTAASSGNGFICECDEPFDGDLCENEGRPTNLRHSDAIAQYKHKAYHLLAKEFRHETLFLRINENVAEALNMSLDLLLGLSSHCLSLLKLSTGAGLVLPEIITFFS